MRKKLIADKLAGEIDRIHSEARLADPSFDVQTDEDGNEIEVEDLSDNPKFNDDPMSGEMDDMKITLADGTKTTFGAVRLQVLAEKK